MVLWKVPIDLAGNSGYNDFEVIYLWGMAFTFPANIQKELSVDEKLGIMEKEYSIVVDDRIRELVLA